MKGTGNKYIRRIGARFCVVLRQGDTDLKVFAGDNIEHARAVRDELLQRVRPTTRLVPEPVAEEPKRAEVPVERRLRRRKGDYFATGSVLLTAAVFMTRAAYDWAQDMLGTARRVDAMREVRS
jgi:hypothetical protein